MGKGNNKGIVRLIKAFYYTISGFKSAWKYEEAFRQEVIVTAFIMPLGLWLGDSGTQKAILILAYLIVPLAELLNTAIEVVVDRIGQEDHVLSERAKDIGSAAVFLSICIAMIVWGIIACERFMK